MNTFCTNSAGMVGKVTSGNEYIANVIPVTPKLMCREVPQAFRADRPGVMRPAFARGDAYALDESTLLAMTYLQLQAAIK